MRQQAPDYKGASPCCTPSCGSERLKRLPPPESMEVGRERDPGNADPKWKNE